MMGGWQIENKDVMTWCKEYKGAPFHAMLTDCPYHLGKDGFMSSNWDAGENEGISFDPATWAALSEHLLPGAFIMAFASTRGWHRMACAMEDAGLIMQPSIFVNGTLEEVPMMFGWLNAQSFPKASRIDTKIDQAAGAEREIVGRRVYADGTIAHMDKRDGHPGWDRPWMEKDDKDKAALWDTAPATDLARAWEGHRYGGQILKNCLEPIIVCQKPWGKSRRLECIVETGAGSLFIDGGRVGFTGNGDGEWHSTPGRGTKGQPPKGTAGIYGYIGDQGEPKDNVRYESKGRWPPNFVLLHSPPHLCADCDGDGCDECNDTGLVGGCQRAGTKRVKGNGAYPAQSSPNVIYSPMGGHGNGVRQEMTDADGKETVAAYQCSEECAARRIREQSGERKSGGRKAGETWITTGDITGFGGDYAEKTRERGATVRRDYVSDTGSCARYFPQFDWAAEVAERLTNSDQIRYCAKSSRSERDAGLEEFAQQQMKPYSGNIHKLTDLRMEKQQQRLPQRCSHPCVKPIALCRWLATLLLPPPEYAPRRILIPFSGVSSEGIGATFAGFDEIVMIEQDAEYCKIGEARMQFWSQFSSYEAAMETARNIQQSQHKQDAQAQSGQLKMTL